MSTGWQIHSESREGGNDASMATVDCPDEEAAREQFGAFRHRVKAGGPTTIHWTVDLRHDGAVIDRFEHTQRPTTL